MSKNVGLPYPISTYHSNIRVLIHEISQNSHLLFEIVLPDFPYPPPVSVLPERLMIHQPRVNLSGMMRRLHRRSSRAMREAHPGALATESRIWEARPGPVQSSSSKRISAGARERAHLSVRIEVLARPEGPALGLAMRWESGLRERPSSAERP